MSKHQISDLFRYENLKKAPNVHKNAFTRKGDLPRVICL